MFRVWADTTSLSLLLAGVVGVVVACTTGPALAMGIAILGGHTEPVMPELSFPWGIWGASIGGLGVGRLLAERARQPSHRRGWRILSVVSAVVCAVVPLLQLGRLTVSAAAG